MNIRLYSAVPGLHREWRVGSRTSTQPCATSMSAHAEEGSSDEKGRESDDEPMLPIEKKAAKLDRKRWVRVHAGLQLWVPQAAAAVHRQQPQAASPRVGHSTAGS